VLLEAFGHGHLTILVQIERFGKEDVARGVDIGEEAVPVEGIDGVGLKG
jgi:hypothetical protein